MSDLLEQYDPNFPYSPVYEAGEEPEQSWEYGDVFGRSKLIQKQIDNLLAFLELDVTKYKNPSVDQTVREHLQQIIAQSKEIMASLD
ncbi:MAG: hypothetical protein J0L70_29925 [Leptolyngbya sp. UWPOB_LEPTO1]|uniref:hypothetical protein n=1 Tax=Leptolyngbya sp. UWPOB_LEPTO1 TaxID=2815653 RepID=UPI001AD2BC65|nr:hypothetical protein [Leptolyngbya sp. UWPOB_LEPTO1]MBN8564755.1 hypothetical protein [Leptolyngbya sp. UWPOB_LEPTO1]